MMVEIARLLRKERLVQLHRIAGITGLSNNYLSQLAIALRDGGLIVGVSGKSGGYYLSRSPDEITVREIIAAVQGRIFATDCVIHPELCMNAEFCESRTIWALLTHRMHEVLDDFTLADLIDPEWMNGIKRKFPDISYLNIEGISGSGAIESSFAACQRVQTIEDDKLKE
jgi:Rrf2 family protein